MGRAFAFASRPPPDLVADSRYYGLTDISVCRTMPRRQFATLSPSSKDRLVPELALPLLMMTAALALASVGGGLYEFLVVDPAWPRRPDLIQPRLGGVSRRRFWIPAHTLFELSLIASLIVAWSQPAVRIPLLTALASHGAMRLWSAFDFIPKALAFERADPATVTEAAARRWSRRSLGRFPLDLVTCTAVLCALVAAARLGA
jgi:hypothetical protein